MEPLDLHEVHAAIGGAVWHMQFLEDALVMYVTMRLRLKEPGAVDMQAAIQEFKAQQKKPLGQLLNDAKAGGLVQGDAAEAFDLLRKERNWLVHHSMRECSDSLETDEGLYAFVHRVGVLEDRSIDLKKALAEDLFSWIKSKGIDVDRINAATEAQFWQKRGLG